MWNVICACSPARVLSCYFCWLLRFYIYIYFYSVFSRFIRLEAMKGSSLSCQLPPPPLPLLAVLAWAHAQKAHTRIMDVWSVGAAGRQKPRTRKEVTRSYKTALAFGNGYKNATHTLARSRPDEFCKCHAERLWGQHRRICNCVRAPRKWERNWMLILSSISCFLLQDVYFFLLFYILNEWPTSWSMIFYVEQTFDIAFSQNALESLLWQCTTNWTMKMQNWRPETVSQAPKIAMIERHLWI